MTEATISEAQATLGALLRRPYERLQARVYAGLAARGFADVRPAHSAVLRYILPGGSRVVDLAERAGMTKQSMAYLAQALADLGYVTIAGDPDDRRAKRVRLTDRGHAVWAALIDLSEREESRAAARLGRARLDALRATLRDLAEVIDENA
ncbi:MarR family transcriptional regulator [Siculibacillus lacustris]|uniref:MarR family transcriptional regulator n=1 Tax=Siculibacillus lacustris TaxID=1549641 RepID=A0A4Q9VMA2_9HYPH|nr:MarR family transcriptional regulator [Siculibacillus lacustris]TBW35780.1 MarR family transcriptional regulator [Siculibacillus lacustris]